MSVTYLIIYSIKVFDKYVRTEEKNIETGNYISKVEVPIKLDNPRVI